MRALLGKVVLVAGLWFSLLGIFLAIPFWLGVFPLRSQLTSLIGAPLYATSCFSLVAFKIISSSWKLKIYIRVLAFIISYLFCRCWSSGYLKGLCAVLPLCCAVSCNGWHCEEHPYTVGCGLKSPLLCDFSWLASDPAPYSTSCLCVAHCLEFCYNKQNIEI